MDFDRFGVPVREDDGSFLLCKVLERHMFIISYRGVDTKVKLADAVRKTSTRVVERTMGVDLLTNNGIVVGAVALNVREGN